MESNRLSVWLSTALVLLIIAGSLRIMQPFFLAIAWAFILALITWPLNISLRKLFRGTGWTALVMTLLISTFIVGGIVLLSYAVVKEIQHIYPVVQNRLAGWLSQPSIILERLLQLPFVGPLLRQWLPAIQGEQQQAMDVLQNLILTALRQLGEAGSNIPQNLANGALTLFIVFFFYRDGEKLVTKVANMIHHLLGERAESIIDATVVAVKGVFFGVLLAAVSQGLVAGIGYFIAGAYPPILLGILTTLFAFIPFAGAPLIWVPASIWLFLDGHTAQAIFLLLWGLLIVSWIDNLVRLVIIGRMMKIPFLLVFFGIVGGFLSFGLIGLFVGPILLSVLMILWKELTP